MIKNNLPGRGQISGAGRDGSGSHVPFPALLQGAGRARKGAGGGGAEREGYAGEVLSRVLQGSLAIQIYIVLIGNMSELRVP